MKDDRKRSNYWKKEDEIYENLLEREHIQSLPTLPTMYHIRLANEGDTISLAKLYDNVFQVYPTPLNKSSYIKQVMKEGTIFYVVECEGVIVSAASAEINTTYHNAELTDCATLKQHRTHGLMKHLLTFLEKELIKREIFCAYSLARALSFGMNAAFHQLGYDYQGRLTKNCFIFDKIEDMNIWVKDLSKSI